MNPFQFLIHCFFPWSIIDILPSSSKTSLFDVCLSTPSKSLQNWMWTFSIGLLTGTFRLPTKSELYKNIGFISVSKVLLVYQRFYWCIKGFIGVSKVLLVYQRFY